MIRIAIAVKCKNDRTIIIALLTKQKDFQIISAGENGYDALIAAKIYHPDIIIMDFNMEYISSSDLAPIIKRQSPSTALIVLCSIDDEKIIIKALKAGISGYLLEQEKFDNLTASIRSVFYGGLYISQSARNIALNYFSAPGEIPLTGFDIIRHSLSPIEQDILCGITNGSTDREIAKNLNINIGSLRNCVCRVKKKTGMRNRTQIIIFALVTGIITFEKIKTFL